MAYTPNTPLASQIIAATQNPINQNFLYINSTMQVNHTWNGNAIAGEAEGTHQKLSMPNQGADITGALPTGIASIMYAIGGNLFAWNGSKCPVSAVAGNVTLTNNIQTPQTIKLLPNDCIGFLGGPITTFTAPTNNTIPVWIYYSISGVYTIVSISNNQPATVVTAAISTSTLQVTFTYSSVPPYSTNPTFKYIYWPI